MSSDPYSANYTEKLSGKLYVDGDSRYIFAKYVGVDVYCNGKIVLEGRRESISVEKKDWEKDGTIIEEALGKVFKDPTWYSPRPYSPGGPDTRDSCLSSNSLISVSNGQSSVKNLKSGDLVWTVDGFGNKVQAAIIKTNRRLVSKDHKIAHIALEDGRKLIVSPGHPTIDNKDLGSLKKGQILDNSKIASIKIMPYKERYTYDILPAGDTGAYWANGILIGSTLSVQFKKSQEEKYCRLYA